MHHDELWRKHSSPPSVCMETALGRNQDIYIIYCSSYSYVNRIEESRAVINQRWSDHTFLWMRRWANIILTGITLRQYRDLLYELLLSGSTETCSTSHWSHNCSIVRQHSEIASETSIWGELTVSKHDKSWNLSWDETYPPVMLYIHDNNKHAGHTGSFLET